MLHEDLGGCSLGGTADESPTMALVGLVMSFALIWVPADTRKMPDRVVAMTGAPSTSLGIQKVSLGQS